MSRVAMGGTFDVLHKGHRALLEAAFAVGDEEVAIGVTTDAFANAHRARSVRPFDARAAAVRAFAQARGAGDRVRVLPIDSPFGFALEPRFTHIVATVETQRTAERINEERARLGLAPLEVVLARYVLADDGRPIKATRVAAGEIDAEGRLRRPLRVAVGSENPVKVEAVRRVALRLYGEADVRGFAVDSGAPEQPFEDETWRGAKTRAVAALAAWPEADFGVGVEAGLFDVAATGDLLDVQACAVADASGRITFGQGPGFAYPPAVVARLRVGESVGQVVGDISGEPDVGRKGGAVGWLSKGHFTREELTEPAVLMAFLPRQRPELEWAEEARS